MHYSDLVNVSLLRHNGLEGHTVEEIVCIIQDLKQGRAMKLCDLNGKNLSTHKLSLLDHLANGLSQYRAPLAVDSCSLTVLTL